ncbi:hypothetical protein P691DRAFT_779690 [Macrolepiota fuliginosa MF-IS2]|uniref:S5 DRBM domain-containing protein n=1 Tax=Macrolepiota fuliginosa MF-IS2 TaxID=1400762 RepID=A0A9P5WZ11_9AGAR|nr:hypothetical protein P691DRAFT_779690 [Macrolepiota fuliginosa MF-IS2]
MQRLAFRPLLRALRVPNYSLRVTRLVPSVAGGSTAPSSARRYTTTTPPPPASQPPVQQEPARISTKASLDPAGVYTPEEYVSIQLNSPELEPFLKALSPEDSAVYDSLLRSLNTENGHTDLLALNDLGEFLAERGVDLHLPDSIFDPPTDEAYYEAEPDSGTISFNEPQKQQENTQALRSLMEPTPHLDARDVFTIPSTKQNPYGGRVITRNHTSIFDSLSPPSSPASSSNSGEGTSQSFALPMSQVRNLYQSILIARTVKQQTGKGKIMRKFFLVLIGDGNGLVGYGQSKDPNARLALQKARIEAVKNMDWVERFEQRTVWTEMETKLGATRLIVRPRPVGFGLRCNPFLHQIMRAAGFKDVSAKVWGSRNKLNVIKAAFRMLHAGHAPVGMGDGVGGKGMRLSKGIGMQGQVELERARGRKLISLRK